MNSELTKKYNETDYFVDDDPPLLFHIGTQNDGLRILFASFNVESAAFVTAWNPRGTQLSLDENYDRQDELLNDIAHRRLNYFVGRGDSPTGDWSEDSYLILGVNLDDALEIANKFDQHALVWIPVSGVPELIICSPSDT
ncbi:MAG: hypothetical protein ACJAVI_001664 [Candidatus Azotimanducaceae bacterium]|jgi:hypothetical protein